MSPERAVHSAGPAGPPADGDLGHRRRGLPAGRLPPHSLGVAGRRPPQRLDLSAGQLSTVRHAAARRLRGHAGADRHPGRPVRAPPDAAGRDPHHGDRAAVFSQVESYPLALVARGLLGCGDAMTYVSVLRLVAGWFPGRRYPVMVTLTSVVGMAGNVVATVPLTIMLAVSAGAHLRDRRWPVVGLRAAAAPARRVPRPTRRRSPHRRPPGGRRVLREVGTPGDCRPAGSASGSTSRRWPDPRCSRCCGVTRT